jgi:hypothetical protein
MLLQESSQVDPSLYTRIANHTGVNDTFSQLLVYSSSQSEGVGDGVGGGVPFITKQKFSSKIKK